MATVDVLGEYISSLGQASENTHYCCEVLKTIEREKIDSNLSIKLTSLGLAIDPYECEKNVRTILEMARDHGLTLPDNELAWLQYREAVMYGYYMWGITRRVDPPIRVQFTDRLGRAVMRHDSFGLLGVA